MGFLFLLLLNFLDENFSIFYIFLHHLQFVQADSMLAVASVNFSPDFSSSLSGCWMQAVSYL